MSSRLFKDKDFIVILVSNVVAIAVCIILIAIDRDRFLTLGFMAICVGLLPSFFIALRCINERLKDKQDG